MSGLNRAENYAGRVSYAAQVIAGGRTATRAFDNCFENYDGDAVAVAVYRRSRKNLRLRANLWRYLGRSSVLPVAFHERRRKNLSGWAAELRAKSRAEFAVWMAELEAKKAVNA